MGNDTKAGVGDISLIGLGVLGGVAILTSIGIAAKWGYKKFTTTEKNICIVGAENSGKTTVIKALIARLYKDISFKVNCEEPKTTGEGKCQSLDFEDAWCEKYHLTGLVDLPGEKVELWKKNINEADIIFYCLNICDFHKKIGRHNMEKIIEADFKLLQENLDDKQKKIYVIVTHAGAEISDKAKNDFRRKLSSLSPMFGLTEVEFMDIMDYASAAPLETLINRILDRNNKTEEN